MGSVSFEVIPERYHKDIVEMLKQRVGDKKVRVKLLLKRDPNHEDSSLLLKLFQELHALYPNVEYDVIYEDDEEGKRLIKERGIKILPVLFFTDRSFFEGLPLGHESAVVLEMIGILANKETSPYTPELLKKLDDGCPRDIRVYVTMACPYCPMASVMALSLPLFFDKYVSRVYVLDSDPSVGDEENVDAVPHIVVRSGSCKDTFIGLPPVDAFVDRLSSCKCRWPTDLSIFFLPLMRSFLGSLRSSRSPRLSPSS